LATDLWEFAVEIGCLRAVGLTNNDLRWLVCRGYAIHATEEIRGGRGPRLFRRTGRLALSDQSCFVLTDAGVALAREGLLPLEVACPAGVHEMAAASAPSTHPEVPRWDDAQHILYWRGQPVKHFKREAPYQEAILAAFQARRWAQCVNVDLPRGQGGNSKERLHEAIKNLNRNLKAHLSFHQEGNGSRVRWEALK